MNLSRVGLLAISYSGSGDQYAQCPSSMWNPLGADATYADYLQGYIGQHLQHGYTRAIFRSPWGENTIGVRVGDSVTTTATPSRSQVLANMLSGAHHTNLRNTTTSGFTTCPLDDRLDRAFIPAYTPYLSLLDELVLYKTIPPNGEKVNGSSGQTPSAWTNSGAAFDLWDAKELYLQSISPRAQVSIAYDSVTSLDPGGVAGALPSQNVLGKAFLDHLVTNRTHRVYVEPHPEKNRGGTSANTAFFANGRFGMISISNPTIGNDRARQVILHPSEWYGPDDIEPMESCVFVDGTWGVNARVDIAHYFLDHGWTVWIEPAGLSPAQHVGLVEAAQPYPEAFTGRFKSKLRFRRRSR